MDEDSPLSHQFVCATGFQTRRRKMREKNNFTDCDNETAKVSRTRDVFMKQAGIRVS